MTDAMIWGFQALAGGALVLLAYRDRLRKEGGAAADAAKEAGRGAALEVLESAFRIAKGRGLRGGYDNSLALCALDECLRRLRAGEDIDAGAAALALDMLGLHLERDEAGAVLVAEN